MRQFNEDGSRRIDTHYESGGSNHYNPLQVPCHGISG